MHFEYALLGSVGLSKDELLKKLSSNPLTPENIAQVISENNQKILNDINNKFSAHSNSITNALKQRS